MKRIEFSANENGSIMVVTLIILALATMIGVAASITASIELQVSGNDKIYAELFYRAEAAAMVGAQAIETTPKTTLDGGQYQSEDQNITLPKVDKSGHSDDLYGDDIAIEYNWEGQISAEAPLPEDVYTTRFLPVEKPAMGASLDLANTAGSVMHDYKIYGRSILQAGSSGRKMGEVIIEVGYKRRY
jgi:hypothetical protein